MRGTTAKRLRVYANYLKNTDEKYKDIPFKRIHRRLKKLWYADLSFKEFARKVVIPTK